MKFLIEYHRVNSAGIHRHRSGYLATPWVISGSCFYDAKSDENKALIHNLISFWKLPKFRPSLGQGASVGRWVGLRISDGDGGAWGGASFINPLCSTEHLHAVAL